MEEEYSVSGSSFGLLSPCMGERQMQSFIFMSVL